jgi:DNA-directed RNA polymerase specialized sigma24 family protein
MISCGPEVPPAPAARCSGGRHRSYSKERWGCEDGSLIYVIECCSASDRTRFFTMVFPDTHLTLVQRLALEGGSDDWQRFMRDYWGPVCRFALRWGARDLSSAESIAIQTFDVLWENRLLVRWVSNRSARLRSLLCSVVRKLLANARRAEATRDRLCRELAEELRPDSHDDEQAAAFYAAWVENLVDRAVEHVAAEYYHQGKVNYVRVLYGRLCQQLSIAELSQSLKLTPSSVDNYYRHAKAKLSEKLQELVRKHTENYALPDDVESEFHSEWGQLGSHLHEHGGLEEAVRRAYQLLEPAAARQMHQAHLASALTRLTTIIGSSRSPKPAAEEP